MKGELEHQFDAAMIGLYEDAKAIGYNATYFLRMLDELGGVATAKKLIGTDAPADGFIELWERGRLDPTVEALATRDEFRPLFTTDDVLKARKRLDEYGDRSGA